MTVRYLITGGAGFIGSHLAELLINHGHEVIIIDNLHSGTIKNLNTIINSNLLTFHKIDVREIKENNEAFGKVDCVFHLAGLADIVPSIEQPKKYYDVNVSGTVAVLEACRYHSIPKVVYAASSSCYGIPEEYPTCEDAKIKPAYPYALTKYLGEQAALHWGQVYGISVTSIRLFNVYGPRSRTSGAYGAVFGVFMAQKIHRKPFTVVGDGTQSRDFTFVTDVAEAFRICARSHGENEVFNIGSGEHHSVNRLCELLVGEIVYIPKRPGEPQTTFANITKIKQKLGWKPTVKLEKGVETMLEHIEDWVRAPLWSQKTIEDATKSWFNHLKED